jgi:hypothetical protein
MDNLIAFVELRMREEAERAQALRRNATNGHALNVDPTALANDIDRTNASLRAAISAYREGRDDGQRLRHLAFAQFRPHPDYVEEWRPELP